MRRHWWDIKPNHHKRERTQTFFLSVLTAFSTITAETDLYAALTAGRQAVGRPASRIHAWTGLLVAGNWRRRRLRTSTARIRDLEAEECWRNGKKARGAKANRTRDGVGSRPGCAAAGATRARGGCRSAGRAADGGPWMQRSEAAGQTPRRWEMWCFCPGCATCFPCAGTQLETGGLQQRRGDVKRPPS